MSYIGFQFGGQPHQILRLKVEPSWLRSQVKEELQNAAGKRAMHKEDDQGTSCHITDEIRLMVHQLQITYDMLTALKAN